MDSIKLFRAEIDYDLAARAWIVYHDHQELSLHLRHRIADIAQGDNRMQVSRMLNLAVMDVCRMMGHGVSLGNDFDSSNILASPDFYILNIDWERTPDADLSLLAGHIHCYVVARILSRWFSGWLKTESELELENAVAHLSQAHRALHNTGVHARRRLPPF